MDFLDTFISILKVVGIKNIWIFSSNNVINFHCSHHEVHGRSTYGSSSTRSRMRIHHSSGKSKCFHVGKTVFVFFFCFFGENMNHTFSIMSFHPIITNKITEVIIFLLSIFIIRCFYRCVITTQRLEMKLSVSSWNRRPTTKASIRE